MRNQKDVADNIQNSKTNKLKIIKLKPNANEMATTVKLKPSCVTEKLKNRKKN
jgi:hypothetical protein